VKKLLVLATGLALLATLGIPPATDAQAVQTVPSAGPTPAVLVAKGVEFNTTLQQPLSSKTNHNGDRFTLLYKDSFFHSRPQLKGALIEGHVENVSPAAPGKKATMTFVFDDIKLPDGRVIPLDAKLVSLKVLEPQTHKWRDTGIIIGSAVAGHAVSKNTGHGGGTLAGAAAGVALVATLKDDIKIKKGTTVTLRLNRAVVPSD
jgi:hypothetical protein